MRKVTLLLVLLLLRAAGWAQAGCEISNTGADTASPPSVPRKTGAILPRAGSVPWACAFLWLALPVVWSITCGE